VNHIRLVKQRFFAVSKLIASCVVSAFCVQLPALSQPVMNPEDSICYMQTSNGRTLNLSNLCSGRRTVATPALSGTDQQFLAEYQNFLGRRMNTSPLVRTALVQAQQSPQSIVDRARGVCSSIQAGISPESTAEQAIDADLINTMALEHYCPEFDE
jgi:hypothetical protein